MQSVLFPAVPYHAGVLRVQCNANHDDRAIDGLVDAFGRLTESMGLPSREHLAAATLALGRNFSLKTMGRVGRSVMGPGRWQCPLIMLVSVVALAAGRDRAFERG